MYSRDLLEDILKKADIVTVVSSYIPVTRKGREYLAICPFHDDSRPSLHISPEKQIFKCFVDGKGGNAFDFVMEYEHCSFPEAVRKVASIMGISDARLSEEAPKVDKAKAPLYACMDDLVKYYRYSLLTPEAKEALDYLEARGLNQEIRDAFLIGYAPIDGGKTIDYLKAKGHSPKTIEDIGIARMGDAMKDANAGRVVFPLLDYEGRPVALSCRKFRKDDDSPKYVNSPETKLFSKNTILYNAHRAKEVARQKGYVYVLEGFMDVIALYKIGEPAVALMGTALTDAQIKLLSRMKAEVRLCLDGDLPGQEAMMRAIRPLQKSGLSFRLVEYKDERDPDDIYAAEGKEGLMALLSNLVDPFTFQLGYYTGTKPLKSPEERRKVVNHFLPYVAGLPSGIEKEEGIARLSAATGYSVSSIRNSLRSAAPEMGGAEIEEGTSEGYYRRRESRLSRIEREVLYYMLFYPEAVKFYGENVDTFYDPVYRECANYVLDYAGEHDGSVDAAGLLLSMQMDGGDEKVRGTLAEIMGQSNYPPYDELTLPSLGQALGKEREKVKSKMGFDRALEEEIDPAKKAELLREKARKKLEGFRKNRRKEE